MPKDPLSQTAKDSIPLLDRLKHPVFGAYAGSWLVWNWKVVYLLLFGIKTPDATISEVSLNYLNWSTWHSTCLPPLGLTAFFLIAGPFLHDGYELLKKWINALVNKVEPIRKTVYVQKDIKINELQTEIFVIQGAYNLVRGKNVFVPNAPPEYGSGHQLPADQLVKDYFAHDREKQKLADENLQLKADLLEAQKRIAELENK